MSNFQCGNVVWAGPGIMTAVWTTIIWIKQQELCLPLWLLKISSMQCGITLFAFYCNKTKSLIDKISSHNRFRQIQKYELGQKYLFSCNFLLQTDSRCKSWTSYCSLSYPWSEQSTISSSNSNTYLFTYLLSISYPNSRKAFAF